MKVTVYEDNQLIENYANIHCQFKDDEIEGLVSYIRGKDNKQIVGTLEDISFLLNYGDIYYFESVDKKCFAYLSKDVYRVDTTLSDLEKLLESQSFVRINKSVVINIPKIVSIKSDMNMRTIATLENDEIQIISRHYKPTFKKALKKLEQEVKGATHANNHKK